MSHNHSQDLLWHLIRRNNAYLVKRRVGGAPVAFSSEPGNVKNLHNRRFSGISNTKTVHVDEGEKEKTYLHRHHKGGENETLKLKGIGLTVRENTRSGTLQRPSEGYHTHQLNHHPRKVAKKVKNVVGGYRKDLVKPTLVRMTKLLRNERPRRTIQKNRRKKSLVV